MPTPRLFSLLVSLLLHISFSTAQAADVSSVAAPVADGTPVPASSGVSAAAPSVVASLHLLGLDHKIYGQEVYNNGPYDIIGCDPEQAAMVISMLQLVGTKLQQQVIPAASKPDSPAFQTFFSTASADRVAGIFSDMNSGTIYPSADKPLNFLIRRVMFACANNNTGSPGLTEAFNICWDNGFSAFDAPATNYIFLCPSFLTPNTVSDYYTDLPEDWICPGPEAEDVAAQFNSTWIDDDITEYDRSSIIIRNLAAKYKSHQWYITETFNLSTMYEAPPIWSLANPYSFATFAAMIIADCPLYPEPFRGRRVITSEGYDYNTTVILGAAAAVDLNQTYVDLTINDPQ